MENREKDKKKRLKIEWVENEIVAFFLFHILQ